MRLYVHTSENLDVFIFIIEGFYAFQRVFFVTFYNNIELFYHWFLRRKLIFYIICILKLSFAL